MANEITRLLFYFVVSGAMILTLGCFIGWRSDRAATLKAADTMIQSGMIIGMISAGGVGCLVVIHALIASGAPVSPCS